MKKRFLFFSTVLAFGVIQANAQTKIGDVPATAPNANAVLELSSSNKGFLLPRVALTSTTATLPMTGTIAAGMAVYNTASVADVTPGFYYNDGARWVRLANTGSAGKPIDTTTDAWVDNVTNTRVELGKTSTGAVRAANSEFVVNDNGSVGIGITGTTTGKVAIVENGTFSQGLLVTNAATDKSFTVGISGSAVPTITNNTSFASIGADARSTPRISSGVVNPGAAYGIVSAALRGSGASDAGTLNAIYGLQIQFGHGENSSSSTQTNAVYGLSVIPTARLGVIGNMYDVFIGDPVGTVGANITNHYSVYNFSSSKSYYRSAVGIGTATPTTMLAVVGLPVFADNAAAAALSAGDFYRTADGTVKVKY